MKPFPIKDQIEWIEKQFGPLTESIPENGIRLQTIPTGLTSELIIKTIQVSKDCLLDTLAICGPDNYIDCLVEIVQKEADDLYSEDLRWKKEHSRRDGEIDE